MQFIGGAIIRMRDQINCTWLSMRAEIKLYLIAHACRNKIVHDCACVPKWNCTWLRMRAEIELYMIAHACMPNKIVRDRDCGVFLLEGINEQERLPYDLALQRSKILIHRSGLECWRFSIFVSQILFDACVHTQQINVSDILIFFDRMRIFAPNTSDLSRYFSPFIDVIVSQAYNSF